MSNDIKKAMQLITDGDINSARTIFLKIIDNDSNNAMALAGIATCHEVELNYDESIDFFNLAIIADKDNFLFYHHLANVYLKKFEANIDHESTSSLVDKSIDSYKKSLELNPEYIASSLGIGTALAKSSKYYEAIKYFDSFIESRPSVAEVYINKGDCYLALNNFIEASKCYQLAIKKDKNNFRAYNNLGLCCYKLLNLDLAKKYLNKALSINSNYSFAYSNLSSVYLTSDVERALTLINKAIELDPNQSTFYINLSQCYMALGDKNKCQSSLIKALELNYMDFNIYYNLSIIKYSFPEDIINFLNDSVENIAISDLNKVFICQSLFNYYDQNKEYLKAYRYLSKSNSGYFNIIQNTLTDSSEGDSKINPIENEKVFFSNIKNEFKNFKFKQPKNTITFNTNPIFILGLPRSGTTLVEQIISAHSDVYGAGEKGALQNIILKNKYPYSFANLSDKNIIELSNYYISDMTHYSNPNIKFITDKLPHNFLYIGLIKQLFPNAKIIHLKRNKMDNCLSIYSKLFVGNLPWSYDWDSVLKFYSLYENLMLFWEDLFPNEIFHCNYELLINDPDNYIKELLNYTGLTHEDPCFSPHLNTRSVTTASAIQVRDKINKSSQNRWDNYKDFFINEY